MQTKSTGVDTEIMRITYGGDSIVANLCNEIDRLRAQINRMAQYIAELHTECETLMRERDECEAKQA